MGEVGAGVDRRVLTIGTFDRFHLGHLRLLERAARYGELHVGVNTSEFVTEYKGRPPQVPLNERVAIVAALRCVHAAYPSYGPGRSLIERVAPDLVAAGDDWMHRGYPEQLGVTLEWLHRRRITLAFLPRTPGVSTTERRS